MTIVDSHLHVWAEDSEHYSWNPSLGMTPSYTAPVDMLLEQMCANGVEKAVLVQPSLYAYDNRYLADCLDRYPGKFTGVALVDPRKDDACEKLEYWVKQHGIQGMRLYPIRNPEEVWLNDKSQYALWRKSEELGVPFIVFIAPRQMSQLEDMVARFPNVNVVVDHLGKPIVEEDHPYPSFQGLLRLASYSNVYVKVSGIPAISKEPYPYKDVQKFVQMVYEKFGPRRLMWATDFPLVLNQCGYAKCLDLVRKEMSFLNDEDKEWILGKTALSVWELGLETEFF